MAAIGPGGSSAGRGVAALRVAPGRRVVARRLVMRVAER
jgi:hypothetical protein